MTGGRGRKSGWRRVERGCAGGQGGRAFLEGFGGAKAGARLFRAGASRPTARGLESRSGRPRSAIIGKSALRFRVGIRQAPQEKPCCHVLRTAGGGRGKELRDCMTARWKRGRGKRGDPPSPARKALLPRPADGGRRGRKGIAGLHDCAMEEGERKAWGIAKPRKKSPVATSCGRRAAGGERNCGIA